MNTEQKVYEVNGIWSNDWLSEADKYRVETISRIVVSMKVKSLIDIGCGNGLFLNYLKDNYVEKFDRLCGIERSTSGITLVNTEKYTASIDCIPINDREFEFVSCQEVIEHLPVNIYEKSIQELGRISNKYVMISVPFNEDLMRSLVVCPRCKTKFNPEYHMRSYTASELKSLEEGLNARLVKIDYIVIREFAFPRLLNRVTNMHNSFPIHTICPMCNYNENGRVGQNNAKSTPNMFKQLGKKLWPKKNRKRWIYAIYEKLI